MKSDPRLVGHNAEHVFLGLLNQRGIFAASLDTIALDAIIYDNDRRLFRSGPRPSHAQIKCRGSVGAAFNPQGHAPSVFKKMKQMADELKIPRGSLYCAVGFFHDNDVRKLKFFGIPLSEVGRFRSKTQFRFSVADCRKEMDKTHTIFEI